MVYRVCVNGNELKKNNIHHIYISINITIYKYINNIYIYIYNA